RRRRRRALPRAARHPLPGLSHRRGPAHLARSEAGGARAGLVVQPDDILLQRVPAGVAGRIAEDLRRPYALIPVAGARHVLEPLQAHALQRKDGLLRLRPAAAVVADLAVRAHHSMAGDEVRDRVVREGGADGPNRGRMADLSRDPTIGPHLAPRDLASLAQHGLLEGGEAAQVEPHSALAVELVPDLACQVWRRLGPRDV